MLVIAFWQMVLFGAPLDPNTTSQELWDHVLAWFEGIDFYQPLSIPPYRVLNYPPLFLFLAVGISKLGVSPLLAGRLLSLLAFAASMVVLFLWFRQEKCKRFTALGLTALLVAFFPVIYTVGQFHHQLLAVVMSLWGLFLIQRTREPRNIYLGALFLALACFVKQTQIIVTLIAFLWLFKYRSRQLSPFVLSLAITGSMGLILLNLVYEREVWRHLLTYTVGTFSLTQLSRQLIFNLLPLGGLAFLAVTLGMKNPEQRKDLRWWYFFGTTIWLLSTARKGSSSAYFTEWSYAMLLWVGPWLDRSYFENGSKIRPKRLISILLLVQIIAANLGVAAALVYVAQDLEATRRALPHICEALPDTPTLVPTESPGVVRACNRKPAHHPFIMASLAKQGLWDQTPFLEGISSGSFPVILLPFDPAQRLGYLHSERWTPQMIKAIADHYRIADERGKWKLFATNTDSPAPKASKR